MTSNDLAYIRICGTCHRLKEVGRPDGQNQRCACDADEEVSWEGFDFNEHAMLCLCCGESVLESGSRWSGYFCGECRLLAMGASIWAERLVIPIGRHSLMHTFVPDQPSAITGTTSDVERMAASAVTTMEVVEAGSDFLFRWSARSVRASLRRLRLSGDVSLVEYQNAIEKDDDRRSRAETFAAMCAFIKRQNKTRDARRQRVHPREAKPPASPAPAAAPRETAGAGREVVLEVGAEGGSLTVFRVTDAAGQSTFEVYRNELALRDLLNEEDRRGGSFEETTPAIATLAGALAELDQYPWPTLFPLKLHPDYAEQVLAAVEARGGAEEVQRWRRRLTRR